MTSRLYTVIAEFRGTTNVSQVTGADQNDAVRIWTANVRNERSFGRASSYLAKSVEADLPEFPPNAIRGTINVWCVTGSCGGDFFFANIVETVQQPNVG